MNQPETNGKAFLGMITYIKGKGGASLLDQIIGATDPATRQVFAQKIMVSDWHPYPTFISLLTAMHAKLGPSDPNFYRTVGMSSGRTDLGAIFAIYKRLASFEKLIRSCTSVWASYYKNAGSMVATEWKPERTVVQIVNFPQMARLHCQLMEGWMVATMEEIGARIIKWDEVKCMSRGDACHEFVCSWHKR